MNVLIVIALLAVAVYIAAKAFFSMVGRSHRAAKSRVYEFAEHASKSGVKIEIRSRADLMSMDPRLAAAAACFIPAAANNGVPMILVSRELMWMSIGGGVLEHEFQHALQDQDSLLRADEDTLVGGAVGYFDNPIEKEAFVAQWASLPPKLEFYDWYARKRASSGDGSALIHIKNPAMRLGYLIVARIMRSIVKI